MYLPWAEFILFCILYSSDPGGCSESFTYHEGFCKNDTEHIPANLSIAFYAETSEVACEVSGYTIVCHSGKHHALMYVCSCQCLMPATVMHFCLNGSTHVRL